MKKQKSGGDFMKRIVLAILVSMPVFAAAFVALQLATGLDPSPYLNYLAPLGAVELALTTLLKTSDRWFGKKNQEENEEDNES